MVARATSLIYATMRRFPPSGGGGGGHYEITHGAFYHYKGGGEGAASTNASGLEVVHAIDQITVTTNVDIR
jgi:N-methylhydantoinase B/oxoprolinase/acetone carboxylase alpha subunit